MQSSAEVNLAKYCAPVLLGKKPASLYTARALGSDFSVVRLRKHGLRRLIIRRDGINELVLLYNAEMLEATIAAAEETLTSLGYPVGEGLNRMLRHLLLRFKETEAFPHEIGFFLGYPPEDVIGFIEHKGQHCKLCGVWKVYSDVERACAMFTEYQSCKVALLSALERGLSIFDCIPPPRAAV